MLCTFLEYKVKHILRILIHIQSRPISFNFSPPRQVVLFCCSFRATTKHVYCYDLSEQTKHCEQTKYTTEIHWLLYTHL